MLFTTTKVDIFLLSATFLYYVFDLFEIITPKPLKYRWNELIDQKRERGLG